MSLTNSAILPQTLRTLLVEEKTVGLLVKGTSMLPYLKEGNRVWIQKVEWDRLRVGDLLAFEQNQVIFTHRLIKKSPQGLLTKGDNNLFPDTPLAPHQILGKAIGFERMGKTYSLDRKRGSINAFLGYSHAGIGMVGAILLKFFKLTKGKLRRPILWVGKACLIPLQIVERIILYAE
jgi:signal peptidase I